MKEIEDLEKEKNNLNAHKERIESELQQKEELLRIEQKEVMGGQAFEEREKEQSKAYREY
jgi:hypothetical protein